MNVRQETFDTERYDQYLAGVYAELDVSGIDDYHEDPRGFLRDHLLHMEIPKALRTAWGVAEVLSDGN